MSITREKKAELVMAYGGGARNTGSTEVQCAILTERIANLSQHLRENKKDFACLRGLLVLVGRRRRLLNYLKQTEISRYLDLISKLGMRKQSVKKDKANNKKK
ncbi:30S ribosomal protein S15 [Rickettsiales endosymbiont of Paramecium tredecaurelia]|uniref:30S ribosomal protein S15 n=1 Tax=Candidatus Sarmatiella mevalonica TaxID=2770581 RepID=UPI00192327C1|nr:30S ribosomal protein S15 [Candidatus Sarmatiella mevalonica]MBL3284246.1 30S ribosomal protein S15 [Candidatus Sarmatiella mevalonica]